MINLLSTDDAAHLAAAKHVLRALDHPLRQRILQFLKQHPGAVVTEVFTALRLEQSVASQHLRILRTAGLVSKRRNGKFIHYSVNDVVIDTVIKRAEALQAATAAA